EAAVEDVEPLSVRTYEYRIAETRSACLDQLKRTGALVREAPVVRAVAAAEGDDVDLALLCRDACRAGDDVAGHLLAFLCGAVARRVYEFVFRVAVEEVEGVHGSLDHRGDPDHRQAGVLPAAWPVPPKVAVRAADEGVAARNRGNAGSPAVQLGQDRV